MKIVDRKTFLLLPAETLFMKYEPCIFGSLAIKGDTIGSNDFLVQYIDSVRAANTDDETEILDAAQESGHSFELDLYCYGRDGEFLPNQLFAVFEPGDLATLVDRLKALIPN